MSAMTTCARCEGAGEVRNYAGDPDAGDLRACPDCTGSGDVPMRTPDAAARRESAPPHGCTGARCETCGDDTPGANAVAQWEARVAEATAELAHARDGLRRAKGDDTPALIAWAVARLLRAASLRCAALVAVASLGAGQLARYVHLASDLARAAGCAGARVVWRPMTRGALRAWMGKPRGGGVYAAVALGLACGMPAGNVVPVGVDAVPFVDLADAGVYVMGCDAPRIVLAVEAL